MTTAETIIGIDVSKACLDYWEHPVGKLGTREAAKRVDILADT